MATAFLSVPLRLFFLALHLSCVRVLGATEKIELQPPTSSECVYFYWGGAQIFAALAMSQKPLDKTENQRDFSQRRDKWLTNWELVSFRLIFALIKKIELDLIEFCGTWFGSLYVCAYSKAKQGPRKFVKHIYASSPKSLSKNNTQKINHLQGDNNSRI